MKKQLPPALLTVISMLVMASCMEIKDYPNEPIVSYKDFRYYDATLLIRFTDGDGNFGIPAGDTNAPFDIGSPYYNNVFISFEQKTDSGFIPYPFDNPDLLNLRVEGVPQPQGQNKTMIGTIEYNLIKALGDTSFSFPDTFRFSFYIYDRALNKSNTGVSPDLTYIRIQK